MKVGTLCKDIHIVDGIWPDHDGYISIEIPWDNLSDEYLETPEVGNHIYIPICELLENHLAKDANEGDALSRQQAAKIVTALRGYADRLEILWINGVESYDQDEAVAYSNSEEFLRD